MTISTKFSIGDEVWSFFKNTAGAKRIRGIEVKHFDGKCPDEIRYLLEHSDWLPNNSPFHTPVPESACFATREELIASL